MLSKIKIKSKKSIGIKEVYDIQVDKAQHYILENGVVSHNSGFLYSSSIIVTMVPLKLKEDEDGNKITEVRGIRSKCKVIKSRYNKPFESVEIKIPYEEGMDEYSGLFDLFEQKKLLPKEGNRYVYTDLSGVQHKHWKKEYLRNEDGILDLMMKEFDKVLESITSSEEEFEEANECVEK